VDQFGTEDLQTLAEFLDLVVYLFFNVGSFLDLIADMNVHESLGTRGRPS
jgi:hypothetical protein